MKFLIVVALCVALSAALRPVIKRVPWLFYLLAAGLVVLFVASSYIDLPRDLWSTLFYLMQKCALSVALFVLVMFIGVFPEDSAVCRWFKPIRAELSIIACILSLGHVYAYLESYLPRILAGATLNTNVAVSFALGAAVFALLLLLGVTSFKVVKKHMSALAWKRVQQLAYVFFILVYAHLFIMLSLAAFRGGEAAITNLAVYSVVFAAYVVLRVRRALVDRKAAVPAEA